MIYYNDYDKDNLEVVEDTRTSTLHADLLPLVKSHGRITINADDALLAMYIGSAIMTIEQHLDMPIAPAAYNWTVPEQDRSFDKYALPLRNCFVTGSKSVAFSVDHFSAQRYIDPPESWPVKLEVGFTSAASVPFDLLTGICQLATTIYESRTTPELAGAFLPEFVRNQIARYSVQRC